MKKINYKEVVLLDKQLLAICMNLILNYHRRGKKVLTHQSHHVNSYESPEKPVE